MTMVRTAFWPLIALCVMAASVPAQTVTLTLDRVDFRRLPTVSFRACVEQDGSLVRGLDASSFTLFENGRPVSLTMQCPDPAQHNSVVLVLDNSGSIFAALPKLIEASKRLVDSLDPADECAIVTFGRSVTVAQAFTSDKAQLHAVLDRMTANGGTPLFDACLQAVDLVSTRGGNRHAVVITDGEDNMSVSTDVDVIADALGKNVTLYTIGFDIPPVYQALMRKLAVETGGQFFAVARPSELTSVYERIADLITERCCIGEYVSASCPDTVRTLSLSVQVGSERGFVQATYPSSARPASALLALDVPDELTPLATGMGFVTMTPAPDTTLELTIGFTLLYDAALTDIPLLPFTFGTVAQNQLVTMSRVGPGRIRVELRGIQPALHTSTLVGFPVRALQADSSRRVAFSIEDAQIEGCPVTFMLASDSTLICQCRRALAAAVPATVIVPAGEEIVVPIRIEGGLEPALTMHFSMNFAIDPSLEITDVESGQILPEGALAWSDLSGGNLQIGTVEAVPPRQTSGILASLRLRGRQSKGPTSYQLKLVSSELWQRCCPEKGPLPETRILQDGTCAGLAVRPARPLTISAMPNPTSSASGGLNVRVTRTGTMEHPVQVMLIDLNGKIQRHVYEGPMAAGSRDFCVDMANLPAGTYIAIVSDGSTTITTSVTHLR